MINPRTLTKSQIQDWLDANHAGDRNWLAERTGNSPGTVSHWFSSRGFSDSALAAIARLMELDQCSHGGASNEADLISFTTGEWERLETAREAVGSPPRPQFYRDGIMRYVDLIDADDDALEGSLTRETPKVAEGEEAGR